MSEGILVSPLRGLDVYGVCLPPASQVVTKMSPLRGLDVYGVCLPPANAGGY